MEDSVEVNDVFVQKGQLPLSAQSAFSAVPTSRDGPRQLTYFNNEKKVCGFVSELRCQYPYMFWSVICLAKIDLFKSHILI